MEQAQSRRYSSAQSSIGTGRTRRRVGMGVREPGHRGDGRGGRRGAPVPNAGSGGSASASWRAPRGRLGAGAMKPLRTRLATVADAAAIAAIYNEGIADRIATFETEPRTAEQ